MEYSTIAGIDKPISRLIQGTTMLRADDQAGAFELLDGVVALGCTAFDTAHLYGLGDVERLLGRWLRDRDLRDRIVIIDKGAHPDHQRRRVTPDDISADLRESLERLQTEYIDLFLLHRDDPAMPVGPIVERLNQHLRAGDIRAFGASNWTHDRIQAANAYAAERSLTPFAASSPHFSLAVPTEAVWEDTVSLCGEWGAVERRWYATSGMPVLAWSTMASGFFGGAVDPRVATREAAVPEVRPYVASANMRRLARARQIASHYDVPPGDVALAYVLRQPFTTFALVGCQTAALFADDLHAFDVPLTAQDIAWLNLDA